MTYSINERLEERQNLVLVHSDQPEAIRALMANTLYFARDDALTTRVFDNAIAMAAQVPVRRLTFAPDARVWDLIDDAQP